MESNRGREWVRVNCTVSKTTDKALLLANNTNNESAWVPRSTVMGGAKLMPSHQRPTLRRWMAEKHNLPIFDKE